ncbi:mannose-1-phosphate guanylyltransferase/mannose-6-phosphate isomerase [soil metagenome]
MAPRPAPPIPPVILCGGAGTRLWPVSRAGYPKQFGRILGERSLFQASVLRLSGPDFAAPVIATGAAFRFIVTEQLAGIGRAASAILIEPEARNTGPAVLAAALRLAEAAPDGLILACPSDHAIGDAEAFRAAIRAGAAEAAEGALVTFGIRPSRAETGYGWLEPAGLPENPAGKPPGGPAASAPPQPPVPLPPVPLPPVPQPPVPLPLARFIEKPDAATAAALLKGGRHLWNSGIFLFSARAIVGAFAAHAPALLAAVREAVGAAKPDLAFLRLDPAAWAEVEAVSLDHAVMEKAANLVVVPYAGSWSDLGAWDAIGGEMARDASGTAVSGPAHALDCERTLLRAESPDQVLVGIGLKDIVAVAMRDAVLVADARDGQRVRQAVEMLKAEGHAQALDFTRVHRPWGWYETLAHGPRFQVKRIMVHPGGVLSLQSHVHRAEHWVVVEGTARVSVGETVSLLGENQSAYIPLGARHRLENPGKLDLHLIEVQSGSYLGEDDITRLDDIYARE